MSKDLKECKGEECAVKVVFIDLDGTVWDHYDISSLRPPFRRVGADTIVDSDGVEVRLLSGVREFLALVKELGIKLCALSWNDPEMAREALEAFDILGFFDLLCIEPHPRKGEVMLKCLKSLGISVDPNEILYIDDRDIHLGNVKSHVGNVRFLMAWRDFRSYSEACEILRRMCYSK